ncbi:hypothetical protein CF15_01660 [Pyrodictium occultum]|uniref:Uncharacterized protein n=1 Tax=Pyrodictium occultum TaxID=2309 RepID=A0A0V8RU27_PYROC|nr:hypothetical protein [Pyrodictium occultum]KSW11569.1 hypothetical protein CF15_01660 [Pyrodictium occultum]
MPLPGREELVEEARSVLERALLRIHGRGEEELVREALADAPEAYAELLTGYLEDLRRLYREAGAGEPGEEELAGHLERLRGLLRAALDCLLHPRLVDGFLAEISSAEGRRHVLIRCLGWENRHLLIEGGRDEDIAYALLPVEDPARLYREMLGRGE